MVEVQVNLKAAPFGMEARNEAGFSLAMDAGPAVGGQGQGWRPMEVLLASLAGCSTIDVLHILRKQRLDVRDVQVRVAGERDPEATPSPFTEIRIHWDIYGAVPEEKAGRAVSLSLEKYCSVAAHLEAKAKIQSSFTVHP